ncbi:MAG: tetratricopeptide repeat protein [Blastocatellia bacterium]|nr:tetratricopeptide repeat protein [Blastocatellia bacterium]
MNLQDVLYYLTGGNKPGPPAELPCPDEAEILGYLDDRISSGKRAKLETHFASCDDCRELLALYTKVWSGPEADEAPPAEETITGQTARILTSIREDEINRARGEAGRVPARSHIFISYAQLRAAIAVLLISGASVYFLTRPPSPHDAAMEELRLVMKDERRIEPRISGNFPYSRPAATRGKRGGIENEDEVRFDIALSELKSARDPSASADDRLALARVYLARDEEGDAARALELLQELAGRGIESPQFFNDTGVALYMRGEYRDAIAQFDEALKRSPDYDEAVFNRALAKSKAGLAAEAQQDWKRFLDLATDEKWKDEARKHLDSLKGSAGN